MNKLGYDGAAVIEKQVKEETGIYFRLSENSINGNGNERFVIWKDGNPIKEVIADNGSFTLAELREKTLAVFQTATLTPTTQPIQTTTYQPTAPSTAQTSPKTGQKSIVSVLMLITACLVRAENIAGMGLNRVWRGINDAQNNFLECFHNGFKGMIGRIEEIKAIASYFLTQVNQFLIENGFTIQLRPGGKDSFYVAAMIKIKGMWRNKGKKTSMEAKNGQSYPAVRMKDGVTFYRLANYQEPAICIEVTNRDRVFMIKCPAPDSQLDLTAWVIEASKKIRETQTQYSGAIFPMVDLRQQEDLSWLLGINTTGEDGKPAIVTQAISEVILKMNENGFLAAAVVAMCIGRGIDIDRGEPYMLDESFLFWIDRPGVGPIFMAHVSEADWKEPANLEM